MGDRRSLPPDTHEREEVGGRRGDRLEVELPFRVLIPRGDPEVVPESAMPSERP